LEGNQKIDGLTFIGEELLAEDAEDQNPEMYLLVPNIRALREIVSLWKLYANGKALPYGFTKWRDLFNQLRDVRPWGPRDRVTIQHQKILEGLLSDSSQTYKIEVELVFRNQPNERTNAENIIKDYLTKIGGIVLDVSVRPEFSYHALLVEVPSSEFQKVLLLNSESLAGIEGVQNIVPQSSVDAVQVGDIVQGQDGSWTTPTSKTPIAAIFDAVPVQAHPALNDYLIVDDPQGLESLSVGQRVHGTAMASLVIHGDLNHSRTTINRKIYFRPVMFAPVTQREVFKADKLVVDLIYEAILRMKQEADCATIFLVNISMGDENKVFSGKPSSWARVLDFLSQQYGILFLVSAGNEMSPIPVNEASDFDTFKAMQPGERTRNVLSSIERLKADRRIIAPADSLNALTVGAHHHDAPTFTAPPTFHPNPYDCGSNVPTISSRLGMGIKRSVKPDVLIAGGKQRIVQDHSSTQFTIKPHDTPSKYWGLKVAAPPNASTTNLYHFTLGTSAATALATNTLHRTYEALEVAYPDDIASLSNHQRVVLMKALLVHAADWRESGQLLRSIVDPSFNADHHHWKRDVSRFLGYGFVEPDDVIACASHRATLWFTGSLSSDEAQLFNIPIPQCFVGNTQRREFKATLAWLSPIRPGYTTYRQIKLKLASLQNDALTDVGVSTGVMQPEWSQAESGTVIHQRWSAENSAASNTTFPIQVQREKDQGIQTDESVFYGLVVSLIMPSSTTVYDEIKARVSVKPASRILV
jgi:Subtilase family